MPDREGFKEEGLWISPGGDEIPIKEHLIAIQETPHLFGLSEREVKNASIKQLRDIAVGLIKSGWIRFRQFGPLYQFEIDVLSDGNLSNIEKILSETGAYDGEEIIISTVEGQKDYAGTIKQFLDKTLFNQSCAGKPNKWRLS